MRKKIFLLFICFCTLFLIACGDKKELRNSLTVDKNRDTNIGTNDKPEVTKKQDYMKLLNGKYLKVNIPKGFYTEHVYDNYLEKNDVVKLREEGKPSNTYVAEFYYDTDTSPYQLEELWDSFEKNGQYILCLSDDEMVNENEKKPYKSYMEIVRVDYTDYGITLFVKYYALDKNGGIENSVCYYVLFPDIRSEYGYFLKMYINPYFKSDNEAFKFVKSVLGF